MSQGLIFDKRYLTNSPRSNRYIVRQPDDRPDDTSDVKSEPNHMRNGDELIRSPAAICTDL